MGETVELKVLSTAVYLLLVFLSVIISVIGSIILLSFFTRKAINVKTEVKIRSNPGVALILGSFIWTIGQMCFESIKPIMNQWYVFFEAGLNFKAILLFALLMIGGLLNALFIGALAVYLSLKTIMLFVRGDEWEEVKNGNLAIAIVVSVTVIVVGMFFESITSFIINSFFHP